MCVYMCLYSISISSSSIPSTSSSNVCFSVLFKILLLTFKRPQCVHIYDTHRHTHSHTIYTYISSCNSFLDLHIRAAANSSSPPQFNHMCTRLLVVGWFIACAETFRWHFSVAKVPRISIVLARNLFHDDAKETLLTRLAVFCCIICQKFFSVAVQNA